LTVVKKLLERKVDLTHTSEMDWTPLQHASAFGDVVIVKALIGAGADVSASSPPTPCPLHIAAANNNADVVRILHENGADLDQKGAGGFNAMMMAVENGCHEVVETLLDLNTSMHGIFEHTQETLYDLAVENEDAEMIELLLLRGIFQMQRQSDSDAGKQQRHEAATKAGEDRMAVTAYLGHSEEIEDRLGPVHGDFQPSDLCGGLFAAAARGHREIVQLLLNKGAPANAKDVNGRTALHYAAFYGHEEVADLLIEKGCSTSVEDDIGSTPIDQAVHRGQRAFGFIRKYMDDLTLNISRRPSLLELVNRQTGESLLSPLEVRKAISGAWTGDYEYLTWQEGEQDPFSIKIPEMQPPADPKKSPSSAFFSSGEDLVGPFQFHGFVDQLGTVWFVKLYEKFGWLYRGVLDSETQMMKGTWGSNRKLWFGTFKLSRALN
jgi:ankyrin repeat protein